MTSPSDPRNAALEPAARWHDEKSQEAMSSLHCGDNSSTIAAARHRARWHNEAAAAIRALPASPGEPVAWQDRVRLTTGEWMPWKISAFTPEWYKQHYPEHSASGDIEFRALVVAAPQPVACPDVGMLGGNRAVVPVEPTEAMLKAACDAGVHLNVTPYGWRKAWMAMLSALPAPPSFENSDGASK